MKVEEMKVAVYGAGAMGTVLGGLLTLGGLKNVHLITRNVSHVQGLREKGAQIQCLAEDKEIIVPVTALLPSEMTDEYDVVFLMTKQRQNEEILRFLLPRLKADAIVCTTQNGLPETSVANVVGNARTFGGVVSFGATFIGGGRVALTSKIDGMSIQICGLEKADEKTEILQEILRFAERATGNTNFVKISENLQGARWSKLAINSAFSGLSVITGCTFGEIAKRKKSRKIALGVLRECMDVANALGVQLESMQGHDMQKMLGGRSWAKTKLALFLLPIAMKKHKKLQSGMLKDLQNGRKCEIDYVNGAVVKAGASVGIPTPLCQKIVELTHDIENGLCEIAYENVDFFDETNKQ